MVSGLKFKDGCSGMNKKLTHFSLISALTLALITSISTRATYAEVPWDSNFDSTTENNTATLNGMIGGRESNPQESWYNHNAADDIPRLTNFFDTSPAAHSYEEAARCKNVYVNKAPNSPTISDDDTVDNCPLPADPEGGADQGPGRVPTTRDLLYLATAVIHADGAGLYKRPEGVSYTNKYIPTIVSATHPTQTHVVTMFGREVTVTFTATSYTWSWGDGTPDVTTTSPGMPWQEGMDPNTDPALIRHYYKAPNEWKSFLDGPYPSATRTITLTTTWAGTATNPFTGETQTINGLVTTTETTGPFPLGQLIVNNTDTSEEKQGH